MSEHSEKDETKQNLDEEIGGTVAMMAMGAVIGTLFPVKGVAVVANAVICALIAWVVWTRRREPFLTTFMICLTLLVIGWPLTVLALDWLHQYF